MQRYPDKSLGPVMAVWDTVAESSAYAGVVHLPIVTLEQTGECPMHRYDRDSWEDSVLIRMKGTMHYV